MPTKYVKPERKPVPGVRQKGQDKSAGQVGIYPPHLRGSKLHTEKQARLPVYPWCICFAMDFCCPPSLTFRKNQRHKCPTFMPVVQSKIGHTQLKSNQLKSNTRGLVVKIISGPLCPRIVVRVNLNSQSTPKGQNKRVFLQNRVLSDSNQRKQPFFWRQKALVRTSTVCP